MFNKLRSLFSSTPYFSNDDLEFIQEQLESNRRAMEYHQYMVKMLECRLSRARKKSQGDCKVPVSIGMV